ncbi:MAG: TonB-dependent receptor [Bacteroidales bacterium]|jgi:TonB-linked SusC/RagA family outer membrane protein|nr:TonB-dependent receptor [Bacteroidales bacterium]
MKQLYSHLKRMMLFSLAFLSFGYASAQIEVSGQVTDAGTGKPIGYADVVEQGTTNGTYTDASGNFKLTVQGSESVLEFTFLGYKKKTVTVGDQTTFKVRLANDAVQLGTVVKTGYMVQKKEDVTGGIAHIGGEEINDNPTVNLDQALQGRAAGVQVQSNSGSPGAAMDIVIRGRGTTGDTRPLYVVDGVPSGYEYKGDPSNIESISILKDASSTAMYGARGANGVVLITTKGGNSVAGDGNGGDYSRISFDGYRGVQSAWKQMDVATAEEYAEIKNAHALRNGDDSVFTASEVADFANTNWQDEVLRDAIIERYNITIDGGSAKSSWSMSAGYRNQEGIVKKSGYERYDIGYKGMYQLTDKLDFGMNTGFNLSSQDVVPEGRLEQSLLGLSLIADPTILPKDSLGEYNQAQNSDYHNPVALYENTNDNIQGYGVGATVWANYTFFDGLDFKTQYHYGFWQNNEEVFTPEYEVSPSQKNDVPNMSNNVQFGSEWNLTNTLTYSFNIRDNVDTTKTKHAFRVLAGQEALYEAQETYNTSMSGISEKEGQQFYITGLDSESRVWVETWEAPNEHTMLSYFGRVEYNFMEKYPVNVTLRRDASSRFGSGNKWGTFPSFGFGWLINKESFFYGNEYLKENINMLKLRGGWGKIGNENVGNYKYVASIVNDARSGYTFGGSEVSGSVPLSIPNENLKWEEATSWSFGVDLQAFKNSLVINADYFIKNNIDNLVNIEVPSVVGIDGSENNPIANVGEINNKGVELSILYRNSVLINEDNANSKFSYSVSGNISKINNEVIELGGTELPGGKVDRADSYVCNTKVGYPIASFFGYKVDGIYQSWEEVNEGGQAGLVEPGDYKFVDVNGDGRITSKDITFIGSPHPDFTYGFFANVNFMSFDLGLQFQGSYGNKIFNVTKWYLDGGYLSSNYSTRRLDVWSEENSGSENPSDPSWFTKRDDAFPHSGFVEDGSYLRLKNITLGYTLPEKVSQKIKLNSFRVYGQIQNALTFTNYSGFDPEIGTNTTLNYEGPEFGVDRGVYPQARAFIIGVNLEF